MKQPDIEAIETYWTPDYPLAVDVAVRCPCGTRTSVGVNQQSTYGLLDPARYADYTCVCGRTFHVSAIVQISATIRTTQEIDTRQTDFLEAFDA